jgi:hypothetical protein
LQPDASSTPLALTPLSIQPQQPEPSALIKWSLAFNALLLTALIVLFIMRRKEPRERNSKPTADNSLQLSLNQKLKLAEKQAEQNNLTGMRDSILDWGKALLINNPPSSLKQLAEQLGDDSLKLAFEQLDRQLYQGDNTADNLPPEQLIKQLKAASVKLGSETSKRAKGQQLNPLYPGGKLSS